MSTNPNTLFQKYGYHCFVVVNSNKLCTALGGISDTTILRRSVPVRLHPNKTVIELPTVVICRPRTGFAAAYVAMVWVNRLPSTARFIIHQLLSVPTRGYLEDDDSPHGNVHVFQKTSHDYDGVLSESRRRLQLLHKTS